MHVHVTTSGTIRVRYTCSARTTYGISPRATVKANPEISEISVKIIKNEVGCRDDTVPKTVDTRRHCEEE